MREIKFRAWCETTKNIYQITDIDFSNYMANGVCNGDWQEFSTSKLLQYTGLKDKNGVEIYEGDIVKTKNSKYKVEYDKCCFWGIDGMGKYPIYQIKHYIMEDEIFKVIGNIYENPELLKGI